jgi:arginyl-tRNA synthetase
MEQLTAILAAHLQSSHHIESVENLIQWQETRPEFEGDLTLVVFPFLKVIKKSPEQLGQEFGQLFLDHAPSVLAFNVVKGFLNITIASEEFVHTLQQLSFSDLPKTGKKVVVEYCSPNTNKPLHLGHVRNNLLGFSVANLHQSIGSDVVKVQVINDRGIHICKSMLAWQKFGNGETPESAGMKGDHLVGKFYVAYDQEFKRQVKELLEKGLTQEESEANAPILLEAREMLQKWEQGDVEVMGLWKTMNEWVFKGFEATNQRMGVSFDKNYYESQTYLLGKKYVDFGLEKGVFYRKDDGSVWIDLTADGLDEKLVLRKDGTSVYITQDIGTALERFENFHTDSMIYTVGNEQDYHFKVLFKILEKLGFEWAKNCFHLSYGMIELPTGKMKSREGTVVDADDLMQEMFEVAKERTSELGKIDGLSEKESHDLFEMIGLGGLKYFLLKVDPKKKMVFNPEESIDTQGNTATFIQYVHARIKSILRKAYQEGLTTLYAGEKLDLESSEKELVKKLNQFTSVRMEAATQNNPGHLCNYVYDLAKTYNKFYTECPIFKQPSPDPQTVVFRLWLNQKTADCLKYATGLLGIGVPEKM